MKICVVLMLLTFSAQSAQLSPIGTAGEGNDIPKREKIPIDRKLENVITDAIDDMTAENSDAEIKAAKEILRKYPNTASLYLVVALRSHESTSVRMHSAQLLGEFGDKSVIKPLVEELWSIAKVKVVPPNKKQLARWVATALEELTGQRKWSGANHRGNAKIFADWYEQNRSLLPRQYGVTFGGTNPKLELDTPDWSDDASLERPADKEWKKQFERKK